MKGNESSCEVKLHFSPRQNYMQEEDIRNQTKRKKVWSVASDSRRTGKKEGRGEIKDQRAKVWSRRGIIEETEQRTLIHEWPSDGFPRLDESEQLWKHGKKTTVWTVEGLS